jgi:hypothetical protein
MFATVLRRRAASAALLAGAVVLTGPALSDDRPATPQGAESIQAVFDRFLPAPPAGSPQLVSVQPDGQSYRVSTDLAAMSGALRGAGANVTYNPAPLVYQLFEQADGKWRVVQDAMPKIVTHAKDATSTLTIDNYHQTIVIDPALAWWTSGGASADRGSLITEASNISQSFDFGPLKGVFATTVNADGSVSSTAKEDIDDIAFKVASTDKDGKSVSSSGRVDKAVFNIGVDGLKSRKLFDLLTLLSVHRADLAQHEAEVKDLMRPLAAPGVKFVEGGEASKVMVGSPLGAIALAGAKFAVGVTNAGPDSAVDARIDAEGLSLPVGIAPPGAADLTPTKIDLDFTVKGIDIAAAAGTAIDNLHLGGPGPAISDADSSKVSAALLGTGPLKIVLAPSHVVAPAIDADLEGELRYAAGKTAGAVTIKMRNFDKTMNAVKGMGPEIATKAVPVIAMAKGLSKTESDGSLSWLVEIGDDRSIKVNGIPLGKAPQ